MSHIGFEYLHFEPGALEERMPLVIYLHGSGHKGTSLERLAGASLPSLLAEELDVPAHVVCPLAKPGPGWMIQHVAIFAEEVMRIHNCDPLRVYITGESMGGRGVFEVCYWHAHLFAAAVPICAFGIPNLAPTLRELPIWMFHGDKDEVLPVERSREMFAALQHESDLAHLKILKGEGHAIGRNVYGDKDVWSWMFDKKRSSSFMELAAST